VGLSTVAREATGAPERPAELRGRFVIKAPTQGENKSSQFVGMIGHQLVGMKLRKLSKCLIPPAKRGGRTRTRTLDPLIKSQLVRYS
jgi:hypothetical protein